RRAATQPPSHRTPCPRGAGHASPESGGSSDSLRIGSSSLPTATRQLLCARILQENRRWCMHATRARSNWCEDCVMVGFACPMPTCIANNCYAPSTMRFHAAFVLALALALHVTAAAQSFVV